MTFPIIDVKATGLKLSGFDFDFPGFFTGEMNIFFHIAGKTPVSRESRYIISSGAII